MTDDIQQFKPIYRCVVADPPWALDRYSHVRVMRNRDKTFRNRPQDHYGLMTTEEIAAIKIPAAPQCHLWLWCLSQFVDAGFKVCEAWGFRPLILLTWAKPSLGLGRFQCNTEHVLVGRKGSAVGNPFGHTGGTWFSWPRGRHSTKPPEFFDLVESASPGPRIELFARTSRPGWDGWGDEYQREEQVKAG